MNRRHHFHEVSLLGAILSGGTTLGLKDQMLVITHDFQPFFFFILTYPLSFPLFNPLNSFFHTRQSQNTRESHWRKQAIQETVQTQVYSVLLYSGSMISLWTSPIRSASSKEAQKWNLGMSSATMWFAHLLLSHIIIPYLFLIFFLFSFFSLTIFILTFNTAPLVCLFLLTFLRLPRNHQTTITFTGLSEDPTGIVLRV